MKTLAVIIPTYNERENLPTLISRLVSLLSGIDYEIMIVDDNSPDKTWEVAEMLQAEHCCLRCIRRVGRRGLSSAVIEGVMAVNTKYIAVIDADLQHDETIIPDMLKAAEEGHDVVIGSRYTAGGGVGLWSTNRVRVSRFATFLASLIFKHNFTDPMSGFFLMHRRLFVESVEQLSGKGFKILLDVLSNFSKDNISIKEIPYQFRTRLHGESKLSPVVVIQFLEFLYSKIFERFIPVRFVKFVLVGGTGVVVNLSVLFLLYRILDLNYKYSLILSIEISIISNFFINNFWTFHEAKIKGMQIFSGLIRFNLSSLLGGVINFIVCNYLIDNQLHWLIASLLGIISGTLWNYNLSRMLTWKEF